MYGKTKCTVFSRILPYFKLDFARKSAAEMASALEQLKKYTTVVADSGDFDSKREIISKGVSFLIAVW